MNNVVLMGRLVRDPEVSATASGMTIARYTLAVERRAKDEADFINCTVFNKGAEFAEKYLHKGTKLVVRGHIQTGSYTKKDGTKVNTTDIVIDEQEFAESKGSGSKTPVTGKDGNNNDALSDAFMSMPDGIAEELPFD